MTSDIGTLLCWNQTPSAAALFWRGAARQARIVLVDELGAACRIAIHAPAGVRMTTHLPAALSFLDHGRRPKVLAEALSRLLGGARAARVLTIGDVDDPELLAACVEAFRPDFVDSPPDAWRQAFEEQSRRRFGATTRFRIDDLVVFDAPLSAPDAPLPVAMIPSGRQATLLLPGCGGGATRVVLHLLAGQPPPDAAMVRLTLDDIDAPAAMHDDRLEAAACDLSAADCHVLRIGHDAAERTLAVVGVEIGPVR